MATVHDNNSINDLQESKADASVLLAEQRALVLDVVALTKSPSLESVVSAVIDDINIQSQFTTASKPSTPGSRLMGTILDGYVGDTFAGFRSLVDSALEFGLIDEKTLRDLTADPKPVVEPLKKALEHMSSRNMNTLESVPALTTSPNSTGDPGLNQTNLIT